MHDACICVLCVTDGLGIRLDDTQPSIPPPKPAIDYSHEASEYEQKLIQVTIYVTSPVVLCYTEVYPCFVLCLLYVSESFTEWCENA